VKAKGRAPSDKEISVLGELLGTAETGHLEIDRKHKRLTDVEALSPSRTAFAAQAFADTTAGR
jgi:hypothetical protein